MDERGWERFAAATGLVFVVLAVVGLFLPGQPPEPGESAETIRAFFLDNREELLSQGFLFSAGLVFFVWFLGALRSALRRSEGGTGRLSTVAYGGGLVVAAMALMTAVIPTALAYRVAQYADPLFIRAMFDTTNVAFSMIGFAGAVTIGAASLVVLRHGALPAWTAWVGALAVGLNLAGTTSIFFGSGAMQPGGDFGFAPLLSALVWLTVTSIALVQKLGAPERV